MENVYKGRFLVINYDRENAILANEWTKSETMSEGDFRSEMLEYRKIAVEKKVRHYLVDNTKMYFTISPELQTWVNENIFPYTMHDKVEKFALVMPEDFIAQISLEQTIEEGEQTIGVVKTRYFDTYQKALDWVLE